ncbi:hypothetical protein QVD17_00597 [Tagetes erecta]|uniref:Protein EARLY FLOWERING 4 domain-containing protein n=1 Tax=Tagetes erecta TaxID=13708 RepID=A0AAD8L850_TARER|nr:hypothetical protein QVD17_00597 [Tagetes erecta]
MLVCKEMELSLAVDPTNSGGKTTKLMETESDDDEECDGEAWEMLNKGLKEVQNALDENRLLIQQVNENHQSMISDNLVKNVALIREINGNILKIRGVYSGISVSLCNFVHRRGVIKKGIGKVEFADL